MRLRRPWNRWATASAIVGVGVLAAAFGVGRESDAPASARIPSIAKAERRDESTGKARVELDLALLNRPPSKEIAEHLFSVPMPPAGITPTPPSNAGKATPADALPERPVAPPIPFRFLGRLTDRGITTAFLAYRGQNVSIKEGDEVDKLYRVQQIAEDRLVFVYLPLNEQQTLPIGGRR